MGQTKLKTTYSTEGGYGTTDTVELYCEYNHTTDHVAFYDKDGQPPQMMFSVRESGNDKWDAMMRLMNPYKNKWNDELKDGVERLKELPWENKCKHCLHPLNLNEKLKKKIDSMSTEQLQEIVDKVEAMGIGIDDESNIDLEQYAKKELDKANLPTNFSYRRAFILGMKSSCTVLSNGS